MNNEFNNINPNSNTINQQNNNTNNQYGYSSMVSAQSQQVPTQNTQIFNTNQQPSYITAQPVSYAQQPIVQNNQNVSYPQVPSVNQQPNMSYQQQPSVINAQPVSYTQQPIVQNNQNMGYPQVSSVNQQTNMSYQQQLGSINNNFQGQIPVSNMNMVSGINAPNLNTNNNQLPVQFSNNNAGSGESNKKSLKDILSLFKSKKFIALLVTVIIVIIALIFGINKLLSGSFGHGYSVDLGTKININETTLSRHKYKFSVDVLETKDISIAKTKYKGYKLAITNNGSSKLKLDGFDIEFTLKNKETGEITSTTIFLSNSYMSLGPDTLDKDLLSLEIPRGKTKEGYIFFKTDKEDIDIFEITIYRNVSGNKTSYEINLKPEAEEEEEPVDTEVSDEESDDTTSDGNEEDTTEDKSDSEQPVSDNSNKDDSKEPVNSDKGESNSNSNVDTKNSNIKKEKS